MNVGTSLVAPARRPCPRCGGAGRARSGRPLRAVTVVALVTGAAGVGAAPVAEHAAPDVIAELVGQLGAGDYAVREIAAARLVELGGPAADALLTAAETSTDLEVALRARWLVEAMPATLGAAGDAPAAAALIDRFQAGDAAERARSLLRLLRLDDDAGIAPLARIARLDRSMSLSRLAARLLVREWLPDDPFWPSVRRHVAAGVGTSGRPAARFLRALVAFSEAPADDERVR
jgi:hypothetical protein